MNSTESIANYRHRLRHSAAHMMADCVLELFPGTQIGIGPAIDEGFYYDFKVSTPFTPDDLQKIERLMKRRVKKRLDFKKEIISKEIALKMFENQPFKIELINELSKETSISIYSHGQFTDLCEGPHVTNTSEIKHFKLLNTASSYWKGDEKKDSLQRIYGTAFDTEDDLKLYLERIAEAEKRDHRKLGKQLDLFMFDPSAPASPFFLPKGAFIFNQLVQYVRNLYTQYNYSEVITPQIFLSDLWKKSGHFDNYKENMYFVTDENREFGIKPMNCPSHALIYKSKLRSYRELPIRLADFGRLHRLERSGVTHGLTRVRSLTQDDAHIFCTAEQIDKELTDFISMLKSSYAKFNFSNLEVTLSLRPEKKVGSEEMWNKAENILEKVLSASQLNYKSETGKGAFYGPKIDFFVPDSIGRKWQLGTVQLDFSMPERFDLNFIDQSGNKQRPVMIHRAMLGSIERFMGILIEHFNGNFPLWLTPIQTIILPIADRHNKESEKIQNLLQNQEIRSDIDIRSERIGLKIREAQLKKIPYIIIIGDKEIEENKISVRERQLGELGTMNLTNLIEMINNEENVSELKQD